MLGFQAIYALSLRILLESKTRRSDFHGRMSTWCQYERSFVCVGRYFRKTVWDVDDLGGLESVPLRGSFLPKLQRAPSSTSLFTRSST